MQQIEIGATQVILSVHFLLLFLPRFEEVSGREYSNDHAVVSGPRNELFAKFWVSEFLLISGKRLVAPHKVRPMDQSLVPLETYAGAIDLCTFESAEDRPTFLDSGSVYRRSPECHK